MYTAMFFFLFFFCQLFLQREMTLMTSCLVSRQLTPSKSKRVVGSGDDGE